MLMRRVTDRYLGSTATPQAIIGKVAIVQRDFRKLLANNSKYTISIT